MFANVRPSPISGKWYEGSPARLAQDVDRYLDAAHLPVLRGRVVAVVAPHAGHLYSGGVAGYAFAAVRGLKPALVVVVSPMHYAASAPLLTTAHDAYETPLGLVRVDADAVSTLNAALWQGLGFGLTPVSRDTEHSLEIELPFLQRALGAEFGLLPVMMRDQSPQVARALGLALAEMLRGRDALLVASSDLSHFYDQRTARMLDEVMLEQVAGFSPDGLFAAERSGKGEACGLAAIAAVLWAARGLGAGRAEVVRYATSGDVTGDFASVVGYGAAVILADAF